MKVWKVSLQRYEDSYPFDRWDVTASDVAAAAKKATKLERARGERGFFVSCVDFIAEPE